jgi:hypothetical protein
MAALVFFMLKGCATRSLELLRPATQSLCPPPTPHPTHTHTRFLLMADHESPHQLESVNETLWTQTVARVLYYVVLRAGLRSATRGTLSELRSWARDGVQGVKWGALIMRIGDRLQLLLQEVRQGLIECFTYAHSDHLGVYACAPTASHHSTTPPTRLDSTQGCREGAHKL